MSFVLFCFVGVDLCCYFFLQIHSTLYCESISRLMAWFHGKNNLRWHFFNCGCQSKLNTCCTLKFRIQKQKNRIRSFLRGYEKKKRKKWQPSMRGKCKQLTNQRQLVLKWNWMISREWEKQKTFLHIKIVSIIQAACFHTNRIMHWARLMIFPFSNDIEVSTLRTHIFLVLLSVNTHKETLAMRSPIPWFFSSTKSIYDRVVSSFFFSFFRSSYYAITTRLFQS